MAAAFQQRLRSVLETPVESPQPLLAPRTGDRIGRNRLEATPRTGSAAADCHLTIQRTPVYELDCMHQFARGAVRARAAGQSKEFVFTSKHALIVLAFRAQSN